MRCNKLEKKNKQKKKTGIHNAINTAVICACVMLSVFSYFFRWSELEAIYAQADKIISGWFDSVGTSA